MKMKLLGTVLAIIIFSGLAFAQQDDPPQEVPPPLTHCEVLGSFIKAFPETRKIGVFYSKPEFEKAVSDIEKCEAAAGLTITKIKVETFKELPDALRNAKDNVDTIWMLDDSLFSVQEAWNFFIMFVFRSKIKTIVPSEKTLSLGGLFFVNDKKESMVNERILKVLELKVSEHAGEVKYFTPGS